MNNGGISTDNVIEGLGVMIRDTMIGDGGSAFIHGGGSAGISGTQEI